MAFALGAMMLALAAAAQPAPDPSNEIVVIARKMRMVRINYRLFNEKLGRCDITLSSGDRRVDRIMCAVLRQCVSDGFRELASAKRCVNRRIERFEQDAAAADRVPAFESRASADPAAIPAKAAEDQVHIVVEGQQVVIKPGQWSFTEQRVSSGSMRITAFRPRNWTLCIADKALVDTIRDMLQGRRVMSAYGQCSEMRVLLKDQQINGQQQCMSRHSRTIARLKGEYDETQLSVTRTTTKMTFYAGGQDRSSIARITGSRVGICEAKR